jgi:hypothetical protein
MKKAKLDNAKSIAEFLTSNGLPNTGNWVKYAFNNRLSGDRKKDVEDILNSLKTEIGQYQKEAYSDSDFKKECYQLIFDNFIIGMNAGGKDFFILIKQLTPVFSEIAESNQLLREVVDVANTLDGKLKFYQSCFAYLILCDGPFKNVEKTLVALSN